MSWLLLSVAQGCNDGWTGFQGSCYLYIPDVYTWFDAKVIVYLNKRGGGGWGAYRCVLVPKTLNWGL